MPDSDLLARKELAQEMYAELLATYPDAEAELNYENPYQLLVATILSAQSTDQRVNQVTPQLFADYPDAGALANADLQTLEELIRPVGLFRNKAAALVGVGQTLLDEFGGEVPTNLKDLVKLPGVGRKTANVVLGNAFGIPGLTPDTHFMRVTKRMGWTKETKPDKVEQDIAQLFDPSVWTKLSHVLIWHGRRCCFARKPACESCPVGHSCERNGL